MILEIKVLGAEHLEDVLKIEEECFSKPWSENAVKELLLSDKAQLQGAFDGDKLVGYSCLEWVLDEGSLTNIAVSDEYRKMGVGSQLMLALMKSAEEKELAFVTLEVRVSNLPAVNLYRKFGFTDVGTRRNYYDAPRENALLMTRYIK